MPRCGLRHSIAVIVLLGVLIAATMGVAIAMDGDRVGFIDAADEDGPAPASPPDFDSTERLALSESGATVSEGEIGIDPTMATGTSFARLEARYRTSAMAAEMDRANGSQEEIAVVSSELDRIEEQISADLALEEEAYTAVANDEMDAGTFLRELSVLHVRSSIIDAELDELGAALRDVTAPVTRDDAQRLRGEVSQAQLEVRTLQGPVTARSAEVMHGDEPMSSPVLMRTGESGYVLSSVRDGIFARQSFAADNRERGSGAGFANIDEARALTADLYPWTSSEAIESEDIPRGEVFSSTIDHPHGTTGIYIDGATERPFRDNHELDLFSMPTVTTVDRDAGNLAVQVDRTYAGGPIQVVVTHTETGDTIADAVVAVDGADVVTTDGDGAAWFIAPGETFDVSIVADGDESTVTVDVPG